MTTRHAGYVVTLKDDIRDDDDQRIITALSMVSGVVSVDPIVSDPTVHIAEARARSVFAQRIVDALHDVLSP